MSVTNRLALPFIDAAQSQKHVTHNEALVDLDALVHLSVKARNVTAPPVAVAEGDRYLIGAGAGGAFAGKTNAVAAFDNGGWAFLSPRTGWRTFVETENTLLLFDGTNWTDLGLALRSLQNLSLLGIGATADANNPLSAKLNSALFAAKSPAEGGTGDLRVTLDKSAVGNTVSQLYQTNWSGRAETGLTGDDHFHIKVSPDGATWREALNVDNATGKFSAPSGRTHALSGADIADFVPLSPTGAIYRVDRQHDQNPRTATIASVTGDTIALTTADADLFFQNVYMLGNCYVRIWNVSQTPNAAAWVKASADTSHLQVTNAADIASWAPGALVQIGDPTSVTPTRAIAIDISPTLQAMMGAVFQQKAVLVKTLAFGMGAKATLDISPSGAAGTYAPGVYAPGDGTSYGAISIVPSNTPSPISNSNLLFLRETTAAPGTIGIDLVGMMGVYV